LKKVRAKTLTLTLLIVDIDYFSEGDRLAISVKGRNAKQNDYLKIGQFHTFCIELDNKLTIYKDCWPQY
jgi:protein pelota